MYVCVCALYIISCGKRRSHSRKCLLLVCVCVNRVPWYAISLLYLETLRKLHYFSHFITRNKFYLPFFAYILLRLLAWILCVLHVHTIIIIITLYKKIKGIMKVYMENFVCACISAKIMVDIKRVGNKTGNDVWWYDTKTNELTNRRSLTDQPVQMYWMVHHCQKNYNKRSYI